MNNDDNQKTKISRSDIIEGFCTLVLVLGVLICFATKNKIIQYIFLVLVIISIVLQVYEIVFKYFKKIKDRKKND